MSSVQQRSRSLSTPAQGRRRASAPGEQTTVQALDRGLRLLSVLALQPQGILLTDLAKRVGLAASTTHRLLTTLQHNEFAELDDATGLWRVGVGTVSVGGAFLRGRDVVAIARPHMRQLTEQSGETSNLAIRRDDRAVYINQVESSATIRAFSKLGDRVPLTCSGVGLALMMMDTQQEIDALLHRTGLPAFTTKSIDTPEKLEHSLRLGRERGFVVDDEAHALGMRCVAAPIFDASGDTLAAVSVSGPTARLSESRVLELGTLVAQIARSITHRLGGTTPTAETRDNAVAD